ncbi:hypothetical protein EYM_03505 [Ignicoccus islandicus DSM 13165]|uniref:Glycosidase n=1 Tax=Ignicoccus islandicus DSM 13165 TaxID=940295 RepID=A0A0U2WN95_9CREN|nr:hypothetical protein [Ignicoccus islandicus]ALU12417.1 hypothetical protein EYM_03505 [Ignicoccus islandicus DSM 13165]
MGLETVEETLVRKILNSYKSLRGIRKKKKVPNVFERIGYVTASQISVTNYPRRPLTAFNPSLISKNNEVHLFIRLIFDYYDYVSSIGYSKIKINEVEALPQLNLNTKLVLYPSTPNEIKRGTEDPRAHEYFNDFLIFYTAVGLRDGSLWPKQGYAIIDSTSLEVTKKGVLYLSDGVSDYQLPSWKNTIALKYSSKTVNILTRPLVAGHEVIWRGVLETDEEAWRLNYKNMDVFMVNESWEVKVGVSTPPVRIGSDEYLIGWHGIDQNLIYSNGIAVVNSQGELLGISDYLLWPSTIEELYGDRPMVIYGSGLLKRGNEIFWIGGVADYAIGIYKADLDIILENVRWLRG